jgi:hypothetical protein
MMGIPEFTIDGILPPFVGEGPGDDSSMMSPYDVDPEEVIRRFCTTHERERILRGWLDHRSALRSIGIVSGFQWLDGSFLEEKEPNDLDVVCFFHLPEHIRTEQEQVSFWNDHWELFDRFEMKNAFHLDAFFLPLDGDPETLVSLARYYLQLFSHQRQTFLWKGMVQVPLRGIEDAEAREQLVAFIPATGQREIQP